MLAELRIRSRHFIQTGARRFGLIVLGLILLVAAFLKPKIDGDGVEYVMMAQAFYRHATPEIKPADIAEMLPLVAKSGLPTELLAAVPHNAGHSGTLFAGFAGGKVWGTQAIHFWMYSLLAVPFHAVVMLFGLSPALAFAALNFLITAVTAGLVLRWFPKAGLVELAFLALLGPVFYLRWTGPEVFGACCALLATLAMIRRDIALSVAIAGFGATQNPAIAGLILAAWAYRGLLALRPAWALLPQAGNAQKTQTQTRTRNLLLTVTGVLLAVLPYAYNEIVFGMPSIIAENFTSPHLISWKRFTSFFLDLNQGMIAGLPGLVLGAVLLAALLGKPFRFRWLAYAAGALGLSFGLALPSLATVNWNNGYIVVLRYAYWAAMPLAALCIVGLSHLAAARRWALLACVIVCQALAMWQVNWPHGTSYLQHTGLAGWVLDHAPSLYNPDPEVFFERETHKEQDLARDRVIVHSGPGGPTKLMRSWMNTTDSGGACPPGQAISSPGVSAAQGWEYYNAPFACSAARQGEADWSFRSAGSEQAALLGEGWSGPEATGLWSEGGRSVLTIPLPKDAGFRRLGIDGMYFRPRTMTDVTINGVHLGLVRLGAGPIMIPPSALHATSLSVVLVHAHPLSPAELGMSTDQRKLAFFLQRIHLDRGPQL